MSEMSEALKEAYASAPRGQVIYLTLELRHSLLTEPIRVVLDKDDLLATLEADAPLDPGEEVFFKGCQFDCLDAEVTPDGIPTIPITIDNVDRIMTAALLTVSVSSGPVMTTIRKYLSTNLSEPENNPPLHMELLEAYVDVFQVRGKLGFPHYKNKRFPTIDYNSTRNPGLAR